MNEAETQIIAYFFLGSARIFVGFGSTKIRLDSAQLFYGSAFAAPASAYRSKSRYKRSCVHCRIGHFSVTDQCSRNSAKWQKPKKEWIHCMLSAIRRKRGSLTTCSEFISFLSLVNSLNFVKLAGTRMQNHCTNPFSNPGSLPWLRQPRVCTLRALSS